MEAAGAVSAARVPVSRRFGARWAYRLWLMPLLGVLALLLARICRSLFWFNPLAHLAERYVRLDQELACDERVLRRKGPAERRLYGETLLATAHSGMGTFQAAYASLFGQIRPRILMLRHHRQARIGDLAGGALVALLAALSIVFGALGELNVTPASEVRKALNRSAQDLYRVGEPVAALQALAQSEELSPANFEPQSLALRSRIFVELKRWDQGLDSIVSAIERSEAQGNAPPEDWLLTRTALEWKLGDLDGAARSLERSISLNSADSHGRTLAAFNDLLQETWEPPSTVSAQAPF